MKSAASWPEPFDRHGTWWKPSAPDHKVGGRLVCTPSDGVRLFTAAVWLEPDVNDDGPSVIVGVAEGSHWTLVGCQRFGQGIGEEFHVSYALDGIEQTADEDLAFDEIRLGFDRAWSIVSLGPRGPRQLDTPSVALSADVGAGVTIELRSELVDRGSTAEGDFEFRDRLVFVGRTAVPEAFPDLRQSVLGPLQNLMTLALQRGATLNHCEVAGPSTTTKSAAGEDRKCATVYWQPFGNPDSSERGVTFPAVRLPIEPPEFQTFMSRWFGQHEALRLPIGLRVADLVSGPTFASTRFLLVAQALEALHRRLYPDETNEKAIDA